MTSFLLASSLSLLVVAAPPAPPPRPPSPAEQLAPAPAAAHPKAPLRRAMKQRVLRITDTGELAELHVAGGAATTLTFPLDVVPARVLLVDTKSRFHAPQATGPNLLLVPVEDLPAGETMSLQVGLSDGTLVTFLLTSVPAEVDLRVDVELALTRKATPESVPALKATIADLQARVDECVSAAADSGAAKVAALILKQDANKPEAFQVERHPSRHLDKQSRLLVETHHVYRLFDLSYVVLTVENRDPSRAWVMERAEVAIAGGGSASDAKVVQVVQELNSIPPGELSKFVVAFATPVQAVGQRFTLRLFEKAGSRHVELTDLSL